MSMRNRILLLGTVIIFGIGCNALPNPMPAFDMGEHAGQGDSAARPSPDTASTSIPDAGRGADHRPPSPADRGVTSDGLADGATASDGVVSDGLTDGAPASDGVTSDGLTDGAVASDGVGDGTGDAASSRDGGEDGALADL